jgi:hypothetical protein
MTAATNTGMNDMNTPKNAQFIVLTPRAHDSGWSKQECHTEVEAFAIACGPSGARPIGTHIVDIAEWNMPTVYSHSSKTSLPQPNH